jgi:serine/threonine-protein kinase
MLVASPPEANSLTPPPRTVITDFGLALTDELTRLTRSDELVGTPAYMAPEQSDLGEITAAADIYALGLIMYEMLVGRPPFDTGPTPLATVLLRKKVKPRPLRNLVPGIDRAWEATIERCLERNPDDRFPRAIDIVASLTGDLPPGTPARARP